MALKSINWVTVSATDFISWIHWSFMQSHCLNRDVPSFSHHLPICCMLRGFLVIQYTHKYAKGSIEMQVRFFNSKIHTYDIIHVT